MNRILCLAIVLFCSLNASPARADDDKGLLDGGSIVGGSSGGFDGGRNAVAALRVANGWTMSIKCQGADTHYLLTADAGLATAADYPLTQNVAELIAVNKLPLGAYPEKRFIALHKGDGGTVDPCVVSHNH